MGDMLEHPKAGTVHMGWRGHLGAAGQRLARGQFTERRPAPRPPDEDRRA